MNRTLPAAVSTGLHRKKSLLTSIMASENQPIHIKGLSDREAIVDTCLRFVDGMDACDEAMITSAFTEDTVFHMGDWVNGSESGSTTAIEGRNKTIAVIMAGVARLDTMHQLSNFRINIAEDGVTAGITFDSLAQHYRPGEGRTPGTKMFLMGNRLSGQVKRGDDGLWRIKNLTLRCRWHDGDIGIMSYFQDNEA